MEQRKYFNNGIQQLEELYARASASGDFALLEDLEEELQHRSTQRAQKLLRQVSDSLGSAHSPPPPPPPPPPAASTISERPVVPPVVPESQRFDKDSPIDWKDALSGIEEKASVIDKSANNKPLLNKPEDVLGAWTALEALSPQTYKKPDDLVIGNGNVAYLRHGQEPWFKGEKSRPKANLYYLVYLGAVNLEQATDKLLKIYQDQRVESMPARGLAALGVIMLDKKGIPIPETGLALSSFGWSYARALEGNLQELRHWGKAERVLEEGLEKVVYQTDRDGNLIPFTFSQAELTYQWLIKNCGIPEGDTIAPSFAIRLYQPFSKGDAEAPLLNSFFLDDLQRVKEALKSNAIGQALSQYLDITRSAQRLDILRDKIHIETALEPRLTPSSRWPSSGRHPLVLLQQTAVNIAMRDLKDQGLFSVNGPPGTGKTTLLRDIVAAVVVKRAKAMSEFGDPERAFESAGKMKIGSSFINLYKLHDSLRGHEIVVASTNNKAVENVSRELPLRKQISEDLGRFNYFNVVSDALIEGDEASWGLIAAVLGNSANRSNFINKAWWDPNTGLRNYFLHITGQIDLKPDENGKVEIPKVIEECDPPKNAAQASERWKVARHRFLAALKKSESTIATAQKALESRERILKFPKDIEKNTHDQQEKKVAIERLKSKERELAPKFSEMQQRLASAQHRIADSLKKKPGLLLGIMSRQTSVLWKKDHDILESSLQEAKREHAAALAKASEVRQAAETAEKELAELASIREKLLKEKLEAEAAMQQMKEICGDQLITPNLWESSHEDQQKFAPNFTPAAQRLRDDLFVAAIELHKAFIDASAKQMRQNLGAFFYVLNGGGLQGDKQALLSHLWSSLFILTPVISTAFASVGRMFKYMPRESIGWLLIDEAGQATPQSAIGAIYRAKRVLSVGDPLQIEPVVTLPTALVDGIARYMGVDPDLWIAPTASVQAVSDRANAYGTTIPRDLSEIRIGSPLLVHRRCENPMFRISNMLAYAGLMVHATKSEPSKISDIFGAQARWFHIAGSAQDKWSPEEGDMVANMLIDACDALKADPDIFVITPFRMVAERMRRRMAQESERLHSLGIENPELWIRENIGTVHTFQGKEAKGVILLLGAPDPAQNGARNWATANVNLLNVAVSRAKQNFYVVGNKDLWGGLGNMKLISKYVS